MAKDKDYDMLLNQYNILVAKHRDLIEQSRVKAEQMSAYESTHDIIEKHARELCEMILAKDREEMVLGNSRTWSTFTTDELIAKAKAGFVKYNLKRTDTLNKIMAIAEQRGQELDSLRDQISQMMTTANIASLTSITADDLLQKAKEEEQRKAALQKTPASTQVAVSSGRIEAIIEEDGDFDDSEAEAIQHMQDVQHRAQMAPTKTKISRSKKKQEAMTQAENNAAMPWMMDLNKITKEWTEIEWFVIEEIGKTGVAKATDISDRGIQQFGNEKKSAIARALCALKDSGITHGQSICLPIKKKISVYYLEAPGVKIFKEHFGIDPVESETVRIMKDHGSLDHGYGIMELQQALIETNRYSEVIMYTRHKPFDVVVGGRKYKYIPDLICKASSFTDYFEYETGTTKQDEFNQKCSKMCQITKFLNFVVPNQPTAKKLVGQFDKWIESRGVASLKGIVIRIGTSLSIKNDGKWAVVYRLSESAEPVENYFAKR